MSYARAAANGVSQREADFSADTLEEKKADVVPKMTHCGGFVVFNPKLDKVALVKTPRGVWGYPKGKREPKKDPTMMDCAYRELWEETSIKREQIRPFADHFYYEINKHNKASVTLFLGVATKEHVLKINDEDELGEVKWVPIEKALSILTTELFGIYRG